mmetsp:Transcript_28700/g.59541  ORF Transcript_28700/g.59541 Transcript_28700/m.59541 type:complete len:86 (+) Transcript_28700:140-397(+)
MIKLQTKCENLLPNTPRFPHCKKSKQVNIPVYDCIFLQNCCEYSSRFIIYYLLSRHWYLYFYTLTPSSETNSDSPLWFHDALQMP